MFPTDHLLERPLPPPSIAALRVISGAGMRDVLVERIEQIDKHGFGPAHDAGHHPGDLALGAASYLNTAVEQLYNREFGPEPDPATWPWQREAWRPGTVRENLVKAVALAWATIDRIDAEAAAMRPEAHA